MQDPVSGLMLPREFIDQKQALKKVIDEMIDQCVLDNQHIRENYFITLHAKFDKWDPGSFVFSKPILTFKLPPFQSNSFVFWISNSRSICELLWMVPAKKGKEPLKVEFNKTGVAYLQAKGAMPT